MRVHRQPWRDETGLLATPVLFVVWSSLLVAVAVIDVGSYLVAASRAQGAADAAALAAVAADLADPAPPHLVARSVAGRNRARVESCECRAGQPRVEVEVSVPVGGLFIARVVGAQRVTATAEAQLVEDPGPPADPPAGRLPFEPPAGPAAVPSARPGLP